MGPGWRSGQLWAGSGSCGIANRPDILEELGDVPGKLWDRMVLGSWDWDGSGELL